MPRRGTLLLAAGSLVVVVIASCADRTVTPPAAMTSTTAATPTSVAQTRPQPVSAPNCHLLDLTGSGMGSVRSADRANPVGRVDVAVLFVDFPDAPAGLSPAEALAEFEDGTEDFLETVSYGRLDLEFHAHDAWLRMSDATDEYGEAFETSASLRIYVAEAIDLADAAFDFSTIEAVLVVATPGADIGDGRSTTWYGRRTYAVEMLTRDGQGMSNAVAIVDTLESWVVAHEIGHVLSLADLYSYANGGLDGYTRPFSLMDLPSVAPEFLAYERYVLGWLDDDQVICQEGDGTTRIGAIEVAGGIKAVMVPLSPSRAIVVESRRALGYDQLLTEVGAVVTVVDTSRGSGEGTVEVVNDHRPLRVGDSVTVGGVTVTVIAADEHSDTVAVTTG